MIFDVMHRTREEGLDVVFVDAPSWYDAREWARARFGEALYSVDARDPKLRAPEVVEIVGRTTTTSHERHVEHIEAVEHRAYERGKRETLESLASLPAVFR